MQASNAVVEAGRQIEVCNACRYCEGYCAVFPAMELRRAFTSEDVAYLANLCHGCKGCYYACQFAPPHEFAVNLPQILSEVRNDTYAYYAWPRIFAGAFERGGVLIAIAVSLAVAGMLIGVSLLRESEVLFSSHVGAGAFYRIVPLNWMLGVAGASFLYSLLAILVGLARFWVDVRVNESASPIGSPLAQAAGDTLILRNLGGAGHGCNDRDESYSMTRRYLHHAMFYGFMLCLLATISGWIYHTFLGIDAPYGLLSAPVILGTLGGIGLLVGPAGLLWLKAIADPEPVSKRLAGADVALLLLLFSISLSGLVLLALRESPAMGIMLALHLGLVAAFFVTAPYCKFVHGFYRSAALLKNRIEQNGSGLNSATDAS